MTSQNSQPNTPCSPGKSKPNQCLEAARQVFTRQGYSAASMDEIAAAAQVSKATVYAHFKSKQGLFAAMMRRECHRCMEQMALPDEVHQLELEPALQRIAASFLAAAMDDGILELMRTVIAESPRLPELGQIFYNAGPRTTNEGVVAYLDRACSQGLLVIEDTRIASIQFLGMLRGDLQMRALMGLDIDQAEVDCLADSAVGAFLRAHKT